MWRARHGDWRSVKAGESPERRVYICIKYSPNLGLAITVFDQKR